MYKYILVFAVVLSFISCSDNLDIAEESAIQETEILNQDLLNDTQAAKRAARDGRNPQTGG